MLAAALTILIGGGSPPGVSGDDIPWVARAYARAGCDAIQEHELPNGAALLKSARVFFGRHAIVSSKRAAKYKLTQDDLQHGHHQVEQLVMDRPALQRYVVRDGPLWEWAAKKFGGEDLGVRVLWDSSEPIGGAMAEHDPAHFGAPPKIYLASSFRSGVRRGHQIDFEVAWSSIVFELYNVGCTTGIRSLVDRVQKDQLDRRGFVFAIFTMESEAIERTRVYCVEQYLDWASSERYPTDAQWWWMQPRYWYRVSERFRTFSETDWYPWGIYGDYYDLLTSDRQFLFK